jgi:hypothetical protein
MNASGLCYRHVSTRSRETANNDITRSFYKHSAPRIPEQFMVELAL